MNNLFGTILPSAYYEVWPNAASDLQWLVPCAVRRHTVERSLDPEWKKVVEKNIAAIKSLPLGWDGAKSQKIDDTTVRRADRILEDALEGIPSAIAPYIVPAPDGSLQFEWNDEDYELEFFLNKNCDHVAWLRERETGQEIERRGTEAVGLLFGWAKRMASPKSDAADVPTSAQTVFVTS